MQHLDILVGFLALFAFSAFLREKTNISPLICPLASISIFASVLLIGGFLGILPWVLYTLYLFSAVCGFWALRKNHMQNFSEGGWLFWLCAFTFLLYFAYLQPVFITYDEYSFWGTSAKQTSVFGKLHVQCPIGTPWQATEFTGLALVSYFFQGFGYFAPWKAIFASNILLLSALASLAAVVLPTVKNIASTTPHSNVNNLTQNAKNYVWRAQIPIYLVALCLPISFTIFSHTSSTSIAWLSFVGDIPAGVLFGASVVFWLCIKETKTSNWWLILPVLCLLANIKNNTFVFALAAAGLIAIDILFFASEQDNISKKGKNKIYALFIRIIKATLCLVAPTVQYAAWSTFASNVVLQKMAEGGTGATSKTLPDVLINGTKMFLGLNVTNEFYLERIDAFWLYAKSMSELFVNLKVSLLGTGLQIVIIIAVIFTLAICLAQSKKAKIYVLLTAFASAVCFMLYWYMLWLSYAFILKDTSPEAPVSYARYISSYYLGWFIIAIGLLCYILAQKNNKLFLHIFAFVSALIMASFVLVNVEPQFSVLGVSQGEFMQTKQEYAIAEQINTYVSADESIYFVRQGDDGYLWFLYSQALLPTILEYGDDGGVSIGEAGYENYGEYYRPYSAEEFMQKVLDSGASYVLVLKQDELFVSSYAHLFADNLESAKQGVSLYSVRENGFDTPILINTSEVE